mmetsp:Transcript_11488/g.26158  ORF Transcript_11488/g.26158 Transcript_11488/m.26158 type:complete len:244 (-) Transcript_11488:444-1175(-)
MTSVVGLHVVAALHVLVAVPFPRGPEGLDGEHIALFHENVGWTAFYAWDRLAVVNLVWSNGVAAEISDWFHLIGLAIQLHLVAFHHLLDGSTHIAQAYINARLLHSSVGGILDCSLQVVELRVEGKRESAIDDAPVDVRPEINLANVIVLEDGLVARVGSVMRSNVVDRAAGGERNAGPWIVVPNEVTDLVLQSFTYLSHQHARLHPAIKVLACRSVDFGGVANLMKLIQSSHFLLLLLLCAG